jgi:MATE family multidrug resistance protein
MLGQDERLAAGAATMVRPMMFGMLPLFFYQILRIFITSLGRPGWSLGVAAVAVISNALINYGLIFGHYGLPRMGLAGAGLGSSISNLVLAAGLAAVVSLDRRFKRYRLFACPWRLEWPRFRAIWRLGLPIGAVFAMETTCFNAAVMLMGLIGEAELAAHAIAIQITNLCFQLPSALGQTATVRVGRANGRRDAIGVRRAGWSALLVTTGFMICVASGILLARQPLAGLFLGNSGSGGHVLELATKFLLIAALFQVADGAQAVVAGMLRGIHDVNVPMAIAAAGYWVIGIGTAILLAFPLGWGGQGIWIGLAAGLAATAFCLVARWTIRTKGLDRSE